ncbi:hypothetical protein H8K32_05665 [Undibacterium jejuense]|uniref:Ceramidase n=1 Tax=Undibacterium jejuense TaxID=1344949 RepID=A0A923KHV2_9BURK|nr:hypothetical protein [Undibacterium jejuense]MBC3861582.1 hypothetical protein [Undibacterium jejuense]
MHKRFAHLPALLSLLIVIGMVLHGPIPQLAHYHDFADQSKWMGMPHAADVLSNVGFVLVAVVGFYYMVRSSQLMIKAISFPAYCVFIMSLLLTPVGSCFYHLAPDDARLFWDRLPIALACASLMCAVHAENVPGMAKLRSCVELCLALAFAVFSVFWWKWTSDLRPYLLLQGLSLILIPVWQMTWRAPKADRIAFSLAMILYVLAKIAELSDGAILNLTHIVSGHSIKHLLAAAAATVIVLRLLQRDRKL